MHKILIINNNKDEISPLEKAIDSSLFTTMYVTNCEEGKHIFDSFLPDIVLCNLQIIIDDNGNLFKYIRQHKAKTTIHILIEEPNNNLIFKAMKFGINNYLTLPLSTLECNYYLKQCKQLLKNKLHINGPNPIDKATQIELTTDNSIEKISEVTNEITQHINPLFFPTKDNIKLCLEELIINAIEHGNLSITYDEKTIALQNDCFEQLVASRNNTQENRNKKVRIIFHQEPTFDEWFIEDEGKGFNPCEIPSITNTLENNNLHGRGILINQFYFDEIEYRDNGKTVRVRIYN